MNIMRNEGTFLKHTISLI